VLWEDHPLYVGRPGTVGDRTGNFAVQNADFLLVLGSRLNIRQISYNWKSFAREAFTVMIDADEAELKKPTLEIDLPIHADLKEAIETLLRLEPDSSTPAHRSYLGWCLERRRRYPAVLPEYWTDAENVNPYCFADELFRQLPEGQPVVTGDGTACVVTFQAAGLKKGQRLYTNSGCASMGYDLPGAIGACIALGRKPLVCLAGDGSIMMNVQELSTIAHHRLPIKIFLLNNRGYHSIRQTQQNFFKDNIVGCGTESGLTFPDMGKLAAAHGLPYSRIEDHSGLKSGIEAFLSGEGPGLCEVVLDLRQQFSPKLSSRKLEDGRMVSSPLEDLYPFLDREELAENMLIAPWDDGTGAGKASTQGVKK
jgi:acetolactate synthase-1/2/3 large subunit